MREIRTSGSMSGEGKRGDAERPKPPRPSSTLLADASHRPAQMEANSSMMKELAFMRPDNQTSVFRIRPKPRCR